MKAIAAQPSFESVVGTNLGLRKSAGGFGFTEGPVWMPERQSLIFSDIPNNEMFQLSATGEVASFRSPSNMANGNTRDAAGRLISCEHATSRVTRAERDGSTTVLAEYFAGQQLNSPNDVVVGPSGDIYFTDPNYGRNDYFGVKRSQELAFQGVYRVRPDGSDLRLLAYDFDQPNGLCFSHDGARLFVNDSERKHIRVFDVSPSGEVIGGELWAEVTGEGEGVPDGMKIDDLGNVYCCGPAGIHVFTPAADWLGVIHVPEVVANFTWGGPDLKTIFVTASTSLYTLRTSTKGQAAP
jgi:gluconolactonase